MGNTPSAKADRCHDLRTPLTVIIAANRTLLRAQFDLSPEACDLIRRAERAALRLARVVDEMLVASGEAEGPSHVVSLDEVPAAGRVPQRR